MTFLGIRQLDEILQILKTNNFSIQNWSPLGLKLGFPQPTLDAIGADSKVGSQCLQECLSQWLSKANEVVKKGGPNWESLANALKSIGEVSSAESIETSK